jgi:hypothetical protein
MKKIICLAGLAGVMAAPNLFASMNVTLYDDTGSYADGQGGEFRAVGDAGLNSVVNWSAYSPLTQGTTTSSEYNSALGSQYFQTFCTETAEEFSPGNSYPVTSIGNNALYAGTGHPVPITLGVAYLYSQFAAGTLAGYDYTYGSGRTASAAVVQAAIWSLLGESFGGVPTPQVAGFALTDLQSSGIAEADWTKAANGAYGVADMTLDLPGQAQDQLVMAVPEASTIIASVLLLLPLGASTLRILRKNRVA